MKSYPCFPSGLWTSVALPTFYITLDRKGTSYPSHNLDTENDKTIRHLEDTISVLQRTREDPSVVGSQALRIVLDRRVESRRIELENLSRNTSVIVQNPSTSTPDPSGIIEDPIVFFGSKENSVIEERVSIPKINVIPPPFEIYQDSQYHIPVIETPSFSVGQENIDPEFLDLNQEVELQSNMDFGYGEDVSPELIEKFKMLKTTSPKIRALTEMYDPAMYPANILKRNEPIWLKNVEDAFAQVMAVVIDIEDVCTDSEADQKVKKEVDEALPVIKKVMQKFLLAYNNKVMTLQPDIYNEVVPSVSRSGSNASSQGSARAIQVTVDIDKEKLTAEIKALNNELKRVDNWGEADSAEVEYAMTRIQSWRKMFKSIQDSTKIHYEYLNEYILKTES